MLEQIWPPRRAEASRSALAAGSLNRDHVGVAEDHLIRSLLAVVSLVVGASAQAGIAWHQNPSNGHWYALMPVHALPGLNQKNPKFQLAISLWKRMPAFVVRPLGPLLIKGLA